MLIHQCIFLRQDLLKIRWSYHLTQYQIFICRPQSCTVNVLWFGTVFTVSFSDVVIKKIKPRFLIWL